MLGTKPVHEPTASLLLGPRGRARAAKRRRKVRHLMGFAASSGANLGLVAYWVAKGNPFGLWAFVAYIGLALSLAWGWSTYRYLEA